jgi:hypothetical protein
MGSFRSRDNISFDTIATAAVQMGARTSYDRRHPVVLRIRLPAAVDEPAADSTFDLLTRAQAGDDAARDRLFTRYLPALTRWASGRLPHWSRGLMDTDDLVQET